MTDNMLTVKEVAAKLRLHERTVRAHVADGTLSALKLGSGVNAPVRIRSEALEAFLRPASGRADIWSSEDPRGSRSEIRAEVASNTGLRVSR